VINWLYPSMPACRYARYLRGWLFGVRTPRRGLPRHLITPPTSVYPQHLVGDRVRLHGRW